LDFERDSARVKAPLVVLALQCDHHSHLTRGTVMVENDKGERIDLELFGILVSLTLEQLTDVVEKSCNTSLDVTWPCSWLSED
jgi:hypothetical protein